MSCDQILVWDTSALIALKIELPVEEQWWFFSDMLGLLRSGAIVVPQAVARELRVGKWPDMPGAWAAGTYRESPRPTEPDWEQVIAVMTATPSLIDAESELDQADPYVIALALHLARDGLEPVVVTNDVVDRLPRKASLRSGCEACGISWIDVAGGIRWVIDH